jgi:hypothetical protein
MNQRIYHGIITPQDIVRALAGKFNRGNYSVQQIGNGQQVTVQIATIARPASGGNTAISVAIQTVEDGVSISIGQQAWFGVAASLGTTALSALRNPFALLGRLDDLAQDIESLQLTEDIWRIIDQTARSLGTGYELSSRLKRSVCEYCTTANPVGEPSCIACGAPLGEVQPDTCRKCGFVVNRSETHCPNCGFPL